MFTEQQKIKTLTLLIHAFVFLFRVLVAPALLPLAAAEMSGDGRRLRWLRVLLCALALFFSATWRPK
jgi:hypothetical protein